MSKMKKKYRTSTILQMCNTAPKTLIFLTDTRKGYLGHFQAVAPSSGNCNYVTVCFKPTT